MSFDFTIAADPSQALTAEQQVVRGLQQIEAHSLQTARVLTRAFASGGQAAKDANGRFIAMGVAGARAGKMTGDAMQHATSSVHGLIAATAAYFSAHTAEQLIDGYLEVSNRMRVVAVDQENLNGLMEESFQVAQDTRQGWGDIANAYQRIAKATEHLGVSQKEVLDLTREISQGLTISGSTQQEAQMTMMELTHAFELGALTGREFRVVLKDATPIVGVLADALGKTRAEFIQMGKHGKITADMLKEGFAKAAPAIQAQFDKMVPTIAQGFTLIRNAAQKFFGEAGEGSGVIKALSTAIKFIADHFETFGKIILGVGEALISLYVIDKIITLVRALTAAIAANPLGALLTAIVVGVSLLRQFGDEWDVSTTKLSNGSVVVVTVGDYLRALWDVIKDVGAAVVDFVENAWSSLTDAFSNGLDDGGIELSLKNVLLFFASFVDAALGLVKFLGKSVTTVFGGIPLALGEILISTAQAIAEAFQAVLNGIITGINMLSTAVFGTVDAMKGLEAMREGTKKGLSGAALEDYVKKQGVINAGPQIPLVDLSFKNPLAGATKAVGTKFKEDFQAMLGETTVKDAVNNFVDKIEEKAAERARKRIAEEAAKKPGYVSDEHGPKGPHMPTKDEENARKKLLRELEQVRSGSNPITEAEMKLAKAIDVTNRAMKANIITMTERNELVEDTYRKTLDAREPFGAFIRDMDAEIADMKLSNEERERSNKIRDIEQDLIKKGLVLSAAQRGAIALEVDQMRGLAAFLESQANHRKDLQSTLDRIHGPQDQFNRGIEIANELMKDGAISADEYQREIDRLNKEYTDGKMTEQVKQTMGVVTDSINTATDALVDFALTGKGSLEDMFRSLDKLIAKFLVLQAVKAAVGGGTGGDVGTVISNSLFGGFATGGSFTIPGVGGHDSVGVAFRATPGEHVTIDSPSRAQQDRRRGERGSGGRGGGVSIHNHFDRRDLLSVIDTPEGHRQIQNVIRKNPGLVK